MSSERTLKGKLVRIFLGVLSLVGLSILTLVAWLNLQSEHQRLARIETQVRTAIASKAAILVESHALALRSLVADNAMGDVRQLVEDAVQKDESLVFGAFLSTDGLPWIYISPTTRPGEKHLLDNLEHIHEIAPPESASPNRSLTLFGQGILEVSRPVVDPEGPLGTIRYGFSTKPLQEALAEVRRNSKASLLHSLQLVALCVFFCMLLGFVWISRAAATIVRPVVSLKEATDRVANSEQGVRVHVHTGDELESLATAFNRMQEANEQAMCELKHAMEAALEASRLKSEFLTNMSHEIRTPMNGVIGMSRLILGMPLESKTRRYAETVDASANALMTIINDILDFSKMEAGKYEIQSVPYEPKVVLQDVAELFAGRAYDNGIELVCRAAPDVPQTANGDPDRYRQILNNLVGNAIKFTESGEIFIEQTLVSSTKDEFVIHTLVQDSGIGIAAPDLAKLFEAFTQVDGSMVRRHGGTGLGLAISKTLATMMGGEIGVTSEPGLGSKFWFTVRLALSETTSESQAKPLPSSKRILVVEGSVRWCRLIEEHLRAWGLDCDIFHDGPTALTRAADKEKKPYDLTLIGASLRGMQIKDFVTSLRRLPQTKTIPLIVLTQLGEDATLSEIENEVTAQISKPLRLSELYDRIAGAFAGEQAVRPARSTTDPPPVTYDGLRVLVVDDNELNRFVATEQLARSGFLTDEAHNGREAVRMVRSGDYAFVLMDCQMPVLDGYDATRQIREQEAEEGTHTPIIALTAHAMVGERDKVLKAGMDDYLTKPLREHALERLLKRYIHLNKAGDDVANDIPRPSAADVNTCDAGPPLDESLQLSARLCQLFVNRVPETLSELEEAVATRNVEQLLRSAHKLKGSSLAIGAAPMHEAAESLEKVAARGEFSEAASRIAVLRSHYTGIRELLLKRLV